MPENRIGRSGDRRSERKDLIPDHALAMCSSLLCREAFATEEISYKQAITYLRKEAITLPVTAPRGYVLLTYRHIPLGL